jgi:hypothetical protein
MSIVSNPNLMNILVLLPNALDDTSARSTAQSRVKDELLKDAERIASGLGKVKDVRTANVKIDSLQVTNIGNIPDLVEI